MRLIWPIFLYYSLYGLCKRNGVVLHSGWSLDGTVAFVFTLKYTPAPGLADIAITLQVFKR